MSATDSNVITAKANSKRSNLAMAMKSLNVKEARPDENQYSCECGQWHILEQTGCRDDGHHDQRCAQTGSLGSPARVGHGTGAGRAGVHRKGPDQARHNAARPDTHEIAPDIDAVMTLIGKGP